MPSDPSSDADAAAVFDFLNDYWDDVEAGGARPLRDYLERYPGAEEAIAAEYLELRRAQLRDAASGAGDGGPGDGGPGDGAPGAERVGPYRVLRELGQGGQGRVVLAEDTRIERRVALKILDGAFVTEERRRRFRREAEVIARLSHPGICNIHEADIEGPLPYIAMQFVEGEVLSVALERARRNAREGAREKSVFADLPWIPRTRFEVQRVLLFFERAARALHAAHEAGVIHRDIKPANIAIDGQGQPVLLDFGLAADEDSNQPGLTRTGDVFGTPAYMSPEQLRGERGAIERGTDVYSLGASLYEALVGDRPFRGEGRFALERAILSEPLADARGLNRALDEDVRVVLETALERDARRRYGSALELAEDLRRMREFEPIRARPAGPGLRLSRWARRQPALAAVLITSFVLLSGALVQARLLLGREQRANRFALGRHLAERSAKLLSEEPAAALLVAIWAAELAPGYLTRSALFAPLERCHLRRVLAPEEAVSRAWDLALSADGETLAVALDNGEVQLWPSRRDGAALRLPAPVPGPGPGPARSIAFHPAGAELAAGHHSGQLARWSLSAAECLARVDLGPGPILWVEYSRDGTRLVAQPAERPAVVFSLPEMERRVELATAPLESGAALFAPDGARLLTASRGWQGLPLTHSVEVTLWDAASGALLHRLRPEGGDALAGEGPGAVQWFEFSPGGERVVAAFEGGSVCLWSTESGEPIGAPLEHDGKVLCATFGPTGRRLVTTTDDGTRSRAFLFDLETGERTPLEGHEGNPIVHASFRPDGERCATASFDRTVRVFDTRDGSLERTLRARFRPLRSLWSHDGRLLYTLSNSASVHVWSSGNQPHGYRLRGHAAALCWADFVGDGERALTGSADGTLRLWSTPARAPGPDALEPGALLEEFVQGADPIVGVELERGGARCLAWDAGGRVALWDLERPQAPVLLLQHAAPVVQAALAPPTDAVRDAVPDAVQGARAPVASVDAEGRAYLWSADGTRLELDARGVNSLRFSRDGRILVALSRENTVRVLDARDGRERSRLDFEPAMAGADGALDVAFHPRRSEIAVACADGRVRFWDPASGASLRAPRALFQHRFLQYSHDGRRLLVLGDTGGASVRVVDVDGEPGAFGTEPDLKHKSRIRTAAFDATGELVLTTSVDGTAYVWSAASGSVLAHYTLHAGALTWGALGAAQGEAAGARPARAITASEDGTAAVWPLDPYPAALERKPRELDPWERARELKLAEPPP